MSILQRHASAGSRRQEIPYGNYPADLARALLSTTHVTDRCHRTCAHQRVRGYPWANKNQLPTCLTLLILGSGLTGTLYTAPRRRSLRALPRRVPTTHERTCPVAEPVG
jgi:hypothetical protein